MASELDQPPSPTQPHVELEQEQPRTNLSQLIQNLTQMKSYEILTSSLKTFAGDFRSMSLMILSIVPLFLFMIFFEIKLQDTIQRSPYHFRNPTQVESFEYLDDVVLTQGNFSDSLATYSFGRKLKFYTENYYNGYFNGEEKFFSGVVQVSLFYLLLYPLLDMFAVMATIKSTAKAHTKQIIVKESYDGSLLTYLCVHLLSTVTLLGLLWIVLNHYLLSYESFFWDGYGYGYGYGYEFLSIQFWMNLLSIGLHSSGFMFLLYKYLGWSACWNMAMVISVLEEETGIEAFGLSDYYGNHCKRTGFQVMLVFFVLCNVLRLPCLYFGLCSWSFGGVCVAAAVVGLFCVGNLVKWVAMVLYFYDCKKQVMGKKGDDTVC